MSQNGFMRVPPQLIALESGCDGEDVRLWKRVRSLETGLGYSNLTVEELPSRALEIRNPLWHPGDRKSPSRKRRLPGVGPSLLFQGLVQRSIPVNNKSTSALSLSDEQSWPWTQLVRPRAMAGRNLPRLDVLPKEGSSVEFPTESLAGAAEAWSSSELREGNLPLSGASVRSPFQEKRPDSRCFEGDQPVDLKDPGMDAPAENPRRFSGSSTAQVKESSTSESINYHNLKPNRHNQLGSSKLAPAENKSRVALDIATIGKQVEETVTTGPIESNGPRIVVEGTLPSKHKFRSFRPGSCGSLLSPKNPLTSNTVVARVKEGLQNGGETRPKVLLVGSGTFNPVHKLHIRKFYLARNFLEAHKGMRVVGGIVSPSHPTLVRQRHRVRAAEIIPPKHRLSMARAAVGEGSWLAVDPWEVTRKRIMDYMSVLEHAKEVCDETFPGHACDIAILYMCQASQIHHLNPAMLRAGGFGVITVCRPLEKERLLKELSPSFRNIAIVVEDAVILSAELEKTSSTMVRHLLKQGKSVEGMVGKAVAHYIRENNIAQRVAGKHRWTLEDNAFMFDQEDKEDRPYHNLPRIYMRQASQMPLHY